MLFGNDGHKVKHITFDQGGGGAARGVGYGRFFVLSLGVQGHETSDPVA
jgi:hypothetical protein